MITADEIMQAHTTIQARKNPTCVYIKPSNYTIGCCTPAKSWEDTLDFPPGFVGVYDRTCDLKSLTDDIREIEENLRANPPERGRFQPVSRAKVPKIDAA